MDKILARMAVLLTDSGGVGRTALNKLLFFSDISHFLREGKAISQTSYVKFEYGPVPDDVDEVRSHLVDNGFMTKSVEMAGSFVQHTYRLAPLSDEDIKHIEKPFSKSEKDTIYKVKSAFGKWSASSLSALSHRYEPWKSADWYGTLNFEKAKSDKAFKEMLAEYKILN